MSFSRLAILLVATVFLYSCNKDKPFTSQWENLNSGTSRSLNRVDFPSVNVGYVLPFKGPLFRTVNGGTTWDSLSSLVLLGDALFDNNIWFVDDSVGFVTTHDIYDNMILYKSVDMGNTWTDITPDSNLLGILKVQFLNSQRGYLFSNSAFDDRFWITDDGGTIWTELELGFSLGSGTGSMPTMFFVNDSTGYLAGGDGSFSYKGAIARTEDAGQNWSLTILPEYHSLINSIHFPNKDIGYVVSSNGDVSRTTNAGLTWDNVGSLGAGANADEIFFIDGETGFIISGISIYKTTDGGNSWSVDFAGATDVNLNGVDFPDRTTGYIVGSNGTILKN